MKIHDPADADEYADYFEQYTKECVKDCPEDYQFYNGTNVCVKDVVQFKRDLIKDGVIVDDKKKSALTWIIIFGILAIIFLLAVGCTLLWVILPKWTTPQIKQKRSQLELGSLPTNTKNECDETQDSISVTIRVED